MKSAFPFSCQITSCVKVNIMQTQRYFTFAFIALLLASNFMAGAENQNIYAWYDAASIRAGNSTPIAVWPDKSGNERHLNKVGAIKTRPKIRKPAGGIATVEFDGNDYIWVSSDSKFGALKGAKTVIMIARADKADGGYLFDSVTGKNKSRNALFTGQKTSPKKWVVFSNDGTKVSVGPSVAIGKFQLHSVVFGAQEVKHFINGKPASSSKMKTAPLEGLILGSRYNLKMNFNGGIAEFVIIEGALTDSEREKVESNLLKKYTPEKKGVDEKKIDKATAKPDITKQPDKKIESEPVDPNIKALPYVDVYQSRDGRYPHYRIPSILATRKGTLLAFAEARQGGDHSKNDIVLRRSEDHGKTWGEMQLIADFKGDSLNDPCAVVDQTNGRILLIFKRYPENYHARAIGSKIKRVEKGYGGPRNHRHYITHSDDDGKSWAPLRDITRFVRADDAIAVGSPGVGIQLTRGKHKNRILFPLYETIPTGPKSRSWRNRVVYSDDHGETWSVSKRVPHDNLKGYGNEAQIAELSNGSILFSSRNQSGKNLRKLSVSHDGGETWSNMFEHPDLPTVACMGSVIRYSWPEEGESILLTSIPSPAGRKMGAVYMSTDEGQTWPTKKYVYPGGFAYSCLVKLANGKVGCLYERDGYKAISLAIFDIDSMKTDSAEQAN